ncbi:MAG TPA: fatty acid desaturase [Leptolyngbya sp.]|jgi:fatty acid desaturase|nr:fatty acid desaturase [Leptolyngbya sp.]
MISTTTSESNLIESAIESPLSTAALKDLNVRSTLKGLLQLGGHFAILGISGYLWGANLGHNWAIAIPAVIVYGFGFAAMFAPMHEASHRTAFANNTLNDVVCWLAGVLSFYNGAFYRRYHKWHHRYTQDFAKDPELSDPLPQTLAEYLIAISGLTWWRGKLETYIRVAMGQLESYPYISKEARAEVIFSVRSQLAVYGVAIVLSIMAAQPWFMVYWLFPLFVGQPILRMILLSEHTGCSHNNNPFTNTRSTKTLFPLQFLMWNMPFHAEHHLYPSIPFHQLPIAHQQLRERFTYKDQGYLEVNRNFVKTIV